MWEHIANSISSFKNYIVLHLYYTMEKGNASVFKKKLR